jgi:hypothetical protein
MTSSPTFQLIGGAILALIGGVLAFMLLFTWRKPK